MTDNGFSSSLFQNFGHQPTNDQIKLVGLLEQYLFQSDSSAVMVVKGYAGTGKTALLSALVKSLPAFKLKSLLLAPTGRAAKVLSSYAGKQAFTIHKAIYQAVHSNGKMKYVLKTNKHKGVVFIVDEASMISDGSNFTTSQWGSGGGLLADLIEYVYEGSNCKLILIGDRAQLPPVKMDKSPAINKTFLEKQFYLTVFQSELQEVVRQQEESGILFNATQLRKIMNQKFINGLKFDLNGFSDVVRVEGAELEDEINGAYGAYGEENTVIICRSNKRANLFNQQIRARIRWLESQVSASDLMMVVKNNYFWLDAKSDAGFIANGDIIELLRIHRIEKMYGFEFADVTIKMVDYPNQPEMDVKIILDAIMTESPALSSEQNNQLYQEIMLDYDHITDKRKKYLLLKKDPYYNALQVKFSYAITCHKSQGGQWNAVFVDQGYLTSEMIDKEYLRWLYTAISRATEKLYLVNFNPKFFVD